MNWPTDSNVNHKNAHKHQHPRKYCRGKSVCTKVFFRSFHIPERACLVVRRLVYLVNIVGAMLIISTRFHYSIDVTVALYLAWRTFRWYHEAIRYPELMRDTPIKPFLRWMEREDIVAIDNAAYELCRTK